MKEVPEKDRKEEKKKAAEERKFNQKEEFLGRSVGGLTTKIHLACVDKDKPIAFILTGGEESDARGC